MLGDSIAAALPSLRAHAESRMSSTCRIEGVRIDTDPAEGGPIEVVEWTAYEGRCRLRARNSGREAGASSTQAVHSLELHIPVGAGPVSVGQRVTMIDSRNPAVVGNRYRVTHLHEADDLTAQRLEVEAWAATLTT